MTKEQIEAALDKAARELGMMDAHSEANKWAAQIIIAFLEALPDEPSEAEARALIAKNNTKPFKDFQEDANAVRRETVLAVLKEIAE